MLNLGPREGEVAENLNGTSVIKPSVPARPIFTKPVELFRQARRPEITRLAETDPMSPPPANRSMGRGSGKDGRLLVMDLIKAGEAEADLWVSEAALRKVAER